MNSIKNKLIVLISGCIFIISALLGTITYYGGKNIILKDKEESFLDLSLQIAETIKMTMKSNINIIESLAERRLITDNTPWEEKLNLLTAEAKRTGFDVFAFADTEGNSTRFNEGKDKAKVSDRDYFIRAMTGVSTYSSVFISRVTGKPSVAVAAPVKRNGKIIGVFYGIRDGNEISNLVKDIAIGKTGYSYIVNKEGTVQGHKNTKLVMESFSPIKAAEKDPTLTPLANLLKKAIGGEKITATYFFNGKDIFAASCPIHGTDSWTVALAMELDEALEGINKLRNIIIIVTFIMLILGFILAYFLGSSISNPIISTVGYSEKMANLDLSEDVKDSILTRTDEIGTLGKSFQTLIGILRTTVAEIIKAAEQVAATTEQIGQDNQNLSQRTSEQASSLEEIAAAIEEANASTRQSFENANQASQFANNTLMLAQDGGRIVEDAVLSIEEINSSSKKIGDIINMINEIAFQTNLLALNAAVEAARAGEQGRGFAVVAGEVRNLAQRAGTAAKEIDNLIKDSLDKIERGTDLVSKSGIALREIIESIQKVNMLVSEMAASSDEQRRGIEQINTAIMELDKITQQNAALVEETAAGSEEMSSQAQELLEMISKFNVGEAASKITEIKKIHSSEKSRAHTEKQSEVPVKEQRQTMKERKEKDILEEEGFEKF